jgi:hypothetical protein
MVASGFAHCHENGANAVFASLQPGNHPSEDKPAPSVPLSLALTWPPRRVIFHR